MSADRYRRYAPLVLRLGLGLVFLWFGVGQLINPESFLGYVPQWLHPHGPEMVHEHPAQWMHSLQVTPHIIIMGNGIFETVFGTLLLLGLFTRISSLLLGIHLVGIMLGLGYNDIAVRDFGLMLATFSVSLQGPDKWCLDAKLKRSRNNAHAEG